MEGVEYIDPRFYREVLKREMLANPALVMEIKKNPTLAWKKLNATFNLTQGFISCSVPLFFDNDSKAIFSYGIHCGPFCEKSSIVLFEQINGTWKQSKILEF